jgi:four helix bundle protein
VEKKNIFLTKSFDFAVLIVGAVQNLTNSQKEFVLSKQLLRSGTSIGALIREAQNAESKADFIHKLAIAQKECDETIYWLELLQETDIMEKTKAEILKTKAEELLKLIRSSILTTKSRYGKKS